MTLTWGVTEGSAEIHDWLGLFSENDEKKPLRHCYVKYNKVKFTAYRMGLRTMPMPPIDGSCRTYECVMKGVGAPQNFDV